MERYVALDGLRAVLMLLGVVLHSAMAYATWTLSVYSAFRDAAHTVVLSVVAFLIHLFRMPAFFLLAGFFGALMWHTRGARAMLHNRVKRVLLPLCVSWVLLFPATVLAAAFTVLGGPAGVAQVVRQLQSGALLARHDLTFGQLLMQLGLIHLWFLYFLLLFYTVMAALLLAARQLPPAVRHWPDRVFGQVMSWPAGVLLPVAITLLTMLPMPLATKDVAGLVNSNAFLPPLAKLAAYFVFFGFGWLLFRHKYLLLAFQDSAWRYTGAGLGAAGLYALCILHPAAAPYQVAAAAPAIWLLALGAIGLAMRYFRQPSGLFRYLAGASYWVYLVHLPLALALPGLLIGLPLPALLKFLLTCGSVMGISLLTYHYWVRTTWLGSWLNGRRFMPYPVPHRAGKTRWLAARLFNSRSAG